MLDHDLNSPLSMLSAFKATGFLLGVVVMITLTVVQTIGKSRLAWFVVGIGVTLIGLELLNR